MAVTLTYPTTPNQTIAEFPFGPWKARIVDVAFDSSYPAGGETLTAATFGWSSFIGAVVLRHPQNRGSSNTKAMSLVPSVSGTTMYFQLYETGAVVDTPLDEFDDTTDASAYTARVLMIGN